MSADSGNIFVSYKDPRSNHNSTALLTHSSLSNYLGTLLTILKNDTEPYEEIQLDFPAFPSVLLKVTSLDDRELVHSILNMALITHDSWIAHLAADNEDNDSVSSSSSSTTMSTEEKYGPY